MLGEAGKLNFNALESVWVALVRECVSQVHVNSGAQLTMSRGVSSSSPQQRNFLNFAKKEGILSCRRCLVEEEKIFVC